MSKSEQKSHSPLYVSERIHTWFHNIISNHATEAMDNKKEIEKLIPNMREDDRVITLYTLVNYKHELTFNREHVPMSIEQKKQLEQQSTDNALLILLYDYMGQVAFYNNDYVEAIKWYQKTEHLISAADYSLDFEKADLYKRIGILYYQVDELFMATKYLEEARAIFSQDKHYKTNELTCRLLHASILSETGNYNEAESEYQSVTHESLFESEMNFYCLRAMGLHYLRYNQLKKAEIHFTTLLSEKDYNPIISAKNKIDLANALFRQGDTAKKGVASTHLQEGMNELSIKEEYWYRSQILYHMYVEYDLDKVEDMLKSLITKGFYFDAYESATEVALHLKQAGDFESALKYMELANKYKSQKRLLFIKGGSVS